MNIETINLAIDNDDALDALADALDPGAILLPASAVADLAIEHGITRTDLIACGAIVSSASETLQ